MPFPWILQKNNPGWKNSAAQRGGQDQTGWVMSFF
jgi:hypothetical protein